MGAIVMIKISGVTNATPSQPLLLLPKSLQTDKAASLSSFVADLTDNSTIKQVIINDSYQIGICSFGWSGWYDVNHRYSGEIVYIL